MNGPTGFFPGCRSGHLIRMSEVYTTEMSILVVSVLSFIRKQPENRMMQADDFSLDAFMREVERRESTGDPRGRLTTNGPAMDGTELRRLIQVVITNPCFGT